MRPRETLPTLLFTALAAVCTNGPQPKKISEETRRTFVAAIVPVEDPALVQEKKDLGLPEESTLEDISRAFLDRYEDEQEAKIQNERERAGGKLAQMIMRWIHVRLVNIPDEPQEPPSLSPEETEIAHNAGWGTDIGEHMETWKRVALQVGLTEDAEIDEILTQYALFYDDGMIP